MRAAHPMQRNIRSEVVVVSWVVPLGEAASIFSKQESVSSSQSRTILVTRAARRKLRGDWIDG